MFRLASSFQGALKVSEFSPLQSPRVRNQGDVLGVFAHAHFYLDGAYVEAITGAEYHIDPLPTGAHEIAVGLNAIDHRAFARDGALVLDRAAVWAPDSRATPLEPRTVIDLPFVGGELVMDGDTLRVTQGEVVEMRWTSDAETVVHLHGYDIETAVSPASPVIMLFEAAWAGRFSISRHTDDGGEADFLYLEVLP